MVQSVVLLGVLNGHHVLHVLHHTHRGSIPPPIAADAAHLGVGDVVTLAAIVDIVHQLGQAFGQGINACRVHAKHVKHQPERRTLAYAREPAHFLHSPLEQHGGKVLH